MDRFDDKDRFPQRRHPRIKNYNYATPNYYFITICTHNKQCIFGQPNALNRFGKIADQAIQSIGCHFDAVLVDKYVVMPNHVHAIIALGDYGPDLTMIIGQYKAHVSKQIHQFAPDLTVWQTSFHDHVIRTQKSYEKIWHYIDTNPVKWPDDCFYLESRNLPTEQ